MRAYFNRRKNSPYHVRMSREDAAELLGELATLPANETPALYRLFTALTRTVDKVKEAKP